MRLRSMSYMVHRLFRCSGLRPKYDTLCLKQGGKGKAGLTFTVFWACVKSHVYQYIDELSIESTIECLSG